jgi:hypothetical protein
MGVWGYASQLTKFWVQPTQDPHDYVVSCQIGNDRKGREYILHLALGMYSKCHEYATGQRADQYLDFMFDLGCLRQRG